MLFVRLQCSHQDLVVALPVSGMVDQVLEFTYYIYLVISANLRDIQYYNRLSMFVQNLDALVI